MGDAADEVAFELGPQAAFAAAHGCILKSNFEEMASRYYFK
jgi:hypothetical protein